MKKFISMVMAAAMVVTMVPATAFAADEASFKIVGADEYTEKVAEAYEVDADTVVGLPEGPQLQIKVKDVDSKAGKKDSWNIKLSYEKVELLYDLEAGDTALDWAYVIEEETDKVSENVKVYLAEDFEKGDDVIELKIAETDEKVNLTEGDIIVVELPEGVMGLTKSSEGTEATVKVTGDFGSSDEMAFVSVVEDGIDVEVDDTVDVAEEEVATLKDITIEPSVSDYFHMMIEDSAELELKLSKGFEFVKDDFKINTKDMKASASYVEFDDNELTVIIADSDASNKLAAADEWVISGLQIEATTAKAGDICTLTVSFGDDTDSVKVEVATVVDYKVVMSVEEDEDVPVFYNGVDSDNTGLTVDDDHESLEVTIEETFAGAWGHHKDWTLSLPEGVHVVAVEANDEAGEWADVQDDFYAAYQEGDHESFEFEKRTYPETDPDEDDAHEIKFVLTLTADPDFVGDVVLTLEGPTFDEAQEVTIAKFVAPYTIKAEQNDLMIDYRYTEVPTDIVITEAEAGLWEKDMKVEFQVEKANYITFEDDAVVTVNEESGMEIDDATDADAGTITLTVEEESDEEPAVITISGISLFMQRNIPAGAYDLEIASATTVTGFEKEHLFAPDCDETTCDCKVDEDYECKEDDHECHVADVADYSDVVKEAWINVVTAGRDQDDASFTTKVVVPVGESYIVAGDKQIALDVPAYINADGYTMLPVRAVATALGINNDAVQWNQATKTVIIMYGQRIITMTAGQSVVYVSGTAIPAASSVEIVDGRAFLGLRDLATTLGVATINWDPATKVASLN